MEIRRGDDLSYPAPTVVRVDVGGAELDVLKGMPEKLKGVRAVFVTVHSEKYAPEELVKYLKESGFSKISWPDASHIAAFR
jgi:hypothetical protein